MGYFPLLKNDGRATIELNSLQTAMIKSVRDKIESGEYYSKEIANKITKMVKMH